MPISPVPTFVRYLNQLAHMLDVLKSSPVRENILEHRLANDMFPLRQQVCVTIAFASRTCFPAANLEIPELNYTLTTFGELQAEIERIISLIQHIPETHFEELELRTVLTQAGDAELCLPGHEFLLSYAIPNFMFHLCAVYAIARSAGVDFGKQDFDGYHQYPKGFSF
ncbi:DUF1993 family protein [Echinimonas agarilytica]|uniref:DUF1993 domain-containing protein n=1 Tax=Echinimonas agarilytica TaxID=1215918 RepID=A0AA42B6E8_9GAMM|nr:DUF1993 domain-containing protein [Echinimonas agarilytica]MCM2678682.1 DUF1993 domain-containing protein [Echinimonas agarilytica]